MGHAKPLDEPTAGVGPMSAVTAARLAETLQALATPSRLLILDRLRDGPTAVTELAKSAGMEQSACSHQLRILRSQGLVVSTRQGRSVIYALYDDHVSELLDQALDHTEHLRLGLSSHPEAH